MTREEIMSMLPGPDMDRLVAEKVMGFTTYEDFPVHAIYTGSPTPTSFRPWQPSIHIAAAMEVMEKFEEISVRKYQTIYAGPRYVCRIDVNGKEVNAVASRPELAICRAALIAVMEG